MKIITSQVLLPEIKKQKPEFKACQLRKNCRYDHLMIFYRIPPKVKKKTLTLVFLEDMKHGKPFSNVSLSKHYQ